MRNKVQGRLCRLSGLALVIVLGFCLNWSTEAHAGLKVYFLRHAEAGHNVVDQWKSVPKEQWPAYVGNPNMFSPKGEEQIVATTKKLKSYHFDFIAVSPVWRTCHTILPYLRETKQSAELWPELVEFWNLDHQHDFDPLPQASTNLFGTGEIVKVDSAEHDVFTLRPDGRRRFKLGTTPSQIAADRWAVVEKDVQMIRQRFGGTDKSILLVSHGNIGSLLLEAFTQNRELLKIRINNTGLWMVEEQSDGRFKLRLLNDEPFKAPQPVTANLKVEQRR